MQIRDRLGIPMDELATLCQRNYVAELALFGSVLRDDFRADSDIDVLVEFEPEAPIRLLDYIVLRERVIGSRRSSGDMPILHSLIADILQQEYPDSTMS